MMMPGLFMTFNTNLSVAMPSHQILKFGLKKVRIFYLTQQSTETYIIQ